jgi:hypothetical protein
MVDSCQKGKNNWKYEVLMRNAVFSFYCENCLVETFFARFRINFCLLFVRQGMFSRKIRMFLRRMKFLSEFFSNNEARDIL